MSRVLVTGANGFIGRQLVKVLAEQDHEVHAVARSTGPASAGVRWHAADLFDPAAVKSLLERVEAQALVHLAWCADPRAYRDSADNLAWTQASLALLRGFAAAGGRRAVFVGSVFEYDWSSGICVEDATPIRPATLYGACKSALASIVAAAAPRLGLSCAWARVFWLYGPHEQPGRLVSSLIDNLLAGRPVDLTAGTQQRDFLHVRDVAAALAAVLGSDVEGPVNIGSGAPVAVRELALRLGSLLGREELIALGARPGDPAEPPLVVADVRRLSGEVGFRPEFDLENGLRATIEWWQRRRAGQVTARA